MTLTKWQKVIGIIVGALTILSILCSVAWGYNKNYIDGRMGRVEQKLDDVIGRLDRNGLK